MYSFYYQRKLSLPCSQERMDLFIVLEGLARRWEPGPRQQVDRGHRLEPVVERTIKLPEIVQKVDAQ